MKIPSQVTRAKWRVTSKGAMPDLATCHAFTMIEIAISLAIIGIALVGIIGVLPLGMNVQRDNREETIINQDASVLLDAIRSGARGLNDLTNYVYAITNSWTLYKLDGSVSSNGVNGYTYTNANAYGIPVPIMALTNGVNIIGLLTTPEFTTNAVGNFLPLSTLINNNGYSNHVVAYVRSMSGPAVEKPPQDNQIIQVDAFGYRLLCVNAPVATDTNIFFLDPADPRRVYNNQLAANQHELRMTFLWPQLPNGKVGAGHQTFRAIIAGQVLTDVIAGNHLYFYQPQSFVAVTNAP